MHKIQCSFCPLTDKTYHLFSKSKVFVKKGKYFFFQNLEHILLSHPAVDDCAVQGFYVDGVGHLPRAYVAFRCRFHQLVYAQLICSKIPKAQKDSQVTSVLLNFWDLFAQKLLVKSKLVNSTSGPVIRYPLQQSLLIRTLP